MKLKRTLGSLMLFCLMSVSVGMTALADTASGSQAVASINDTQYDSLQEAVNAAENGDTVTLLQNCEEQQFQVPNEKAIIFNRTDQHYTLGTVGEQITAVARVHYTSGINDKINMETTEIYGGFEAVVDLVTTLQPNNYILNLYDSVTLTKDLTIPNNVGGSTCTSVNTRKDLTIDLNGHTLNQSKGSGWNNYALLNAKDGTTLTIQDSSEGQTGCVSGIGTTVYTDTGVIRFKSGTITATSERSEYDIAHYNYRIPVRVDDTGTFIMEGGKITSDFSETETLGTALYIYIAGESARFTVAGGNLLDDCSVDVPAKQITTNIFPQSSGTFAVEPASGLKHYGVFYDDGSGTITLKSGLYATPVTVNDTESPFDYVAEGYTQDDSTKAVYNVSDSVSADYPYIVLPVYTVSFDSGNGTPDSIPSQSVIWGNTAQKPEDPSYEKHTFAGWSADASGNPFDFENSPVKKDLALTAIWNVTVTYNWSGKVPEKAVLPSAVTDKAGFTLTVSGPAKGEKCFEDKNGYYTFSGWFLDKEMTLPADKELQVSEDTDLYGSWSYTKKTPAEDKPSTPQKPTEVIKPPAQTTPGTESASASTNATAAQTTAAPKTGDSSMLLLWTSLMLTGSIAVPVTTFRRKRR